MGQQVYRTTDKQFEQVWEDENTRHLAQQRSANMKREAGTRSSIPTFRPTTVSGRTQLMVNTQNRKQIYYLHRSTCLRNVLISNKINLLQNSSRKKWMARKNQMCFHSRICSMLHPLTAGKCCDQVRRIIVGSNLAAVLPFMHLSM